MSKIENAWVDTYFNHGVDIANRRVFVGEIDSDSIEIVIKGLYLMEGESTTKPCEMFISSFGGQVYDALALYDIIQTLQCPIHTFAYGKCMSAAPLLLAAGEPGHRWVAEHVAFMTHEASDEMEGKVQDLEKAVAHTKALDKIWNNLLAKHSNKDYRFWAGKSRKPFDFYFGADKAIEWGIADAIWREKSD